LQQDAGYKNCIKENHARVMASFPPFFDQKI